MTPRSLELPGSWPTPTRRLDVPKATCSIPECSRAYYGRGWCRLHYSRWYRTGDVGGLEARPTNVPWQERFWSKVQKGEGCWEWQGRRFPFGYGAFYLEGQWNGAHRASWRVHFGEIPDGLWVLHRCDNPPCVRPDHLFLGTHLDNVRDMCRKGRKRPRGSRMRSGDATPKAGEH